MGGSVDIERSLYPLKLDTKWRVLHLHSGRVFIAFIKLLKGIHPSKVRDSRFKKHQM